jgi:NADH-quinone oxidoreductase subunit M
MIGILGRGDRKEVAWKTTIYLAFGSIVLLAGLLMIADQLGSFDMTQLKPVESHQNEIALLLIIGFGTLVSLFPFHSWAAPAYASAPAPVSMLHAGVLKKFGLYGLIVVGYEVVPDGMAHWLPLLLVLLLCNIIWVGLVTINQKRLDLMLGNSSVMHMGYIFLAIAALVDNGSSFAMQAAVLLMFAHGISIAMSFCLADRIEAKTGTLEINQLGGLAKNAPSLAFLFGLVGMASIGLPGLANFAGEIMVFFSGFEGWEPTDGLGPLQITTIIAIWGVVISAVYMLRAFRNIFQGETVSRTEKVTCLSRDEKIPAILLGLILLIVGIYPQAILQFLN